MKRPEPGEAAPPTAVTERDLVPPFESAARDQGSEYVPPVAPPALSAHRTLEMDLVKVDPEADGRRARTVRMERGPSRAPVPGSRRRAAASVVATLAVVTAAGAGILWMNARRPIPPTVEAPAPRTATAPPEAAGPAPTSLATPVQASSGSGTATPLVSAPTPVAEPPPARRTGGEPSSTSAGGRRSVPEHGAPASAGTPSPTPRPIFE